MCGDGRLVNMKAYVSGRLGGIEAGACGACGASAFFLSFFTLYILKFMELYVRSYHWYDV